MNLQILAKAMPEKSIHAYQAIGSFPIRREICSGMSTERTPTIIAMQMVIAMIQSRILAKTSATIANTKEMPIIAMAATTNAVHFPKGGDDGQRR
jgi:hypothetical protein